MGERERGGEGTKQILLLQLTKESLRIKKYNYVCCFVEGDNVDVSRNVSHL